MYLNTLNGKSKHSYCVVKCLTVTRQLMFCTHAVQVLDMFEHT